MGDLGDVSGGLGVGVVYDRVASNDLSVAAPSGYIPAGALQYLLMMCQVLEMY